MIGEQDFYTPYWEGHGSFVNDMMNKLINQTGHINDLQEVIDVLKMYQMKLNP